MWGIVSEGEGSLGVSRGDKAHTSGLTEHGPWTADRKETLPFHRSLLGIELNRKAECVAYGTSCEAEHQLRGPGRVPSGPWELILGRWSLRSNGLQVSKAKVKMLFLQL